MSTGFPVHSVDLRDGRRATLRLLRPEDAPAFLALQRALHEDGRGMVRSVRQVPTDAATVRREIAARTSEDRRVDLVAELEDPARTIAGDATLQGIPVDYCAHVGILALGVHPDHQGIGLGRALMEALIAQAATLGMTRLELYVRGDNHRARALYASLGFVEEGVRRRFVRLPDGTHVDDHIMARLLD